MKLISFFILVSIASNAICEETAVGNNAYFDRYSSSYCGNKRFLICADMEKEQCMQAVRRASDECYSKHFNDGKMAENKMGPTLHFICMKSELPKQKELISNEFCLELPSAISKTNMWKTHSEPSNLSASVCTAEDWPLKHALPFQGASNAKVLT